ncbi:hypothetical protein ACL02S_03825 [Nocardia sp. 004]|uniref:hypothetical protein n=1 Tax=Nocardia sp. 004 TaxID=3385978 RepID=UPI0039A37CF5
MSPSAPRNNSDADLTPLAPIAVLAGVMMVSAAIVSITRFPGWAVDYGVLMVAAAILYLTAATWLVRWGVCQLRNHSGGT